MSYFCISTLPCAPTAMKNNHPSRSPHRPVVPHNGRATCFLCPLAVRCILKCPSFDYAVGYFCQLWFWFLLLLLLISPTIPTPSWPSLSVCCILQPLVFSHLGECWVCVCVCVCVGGGTVGSLWLLGVWVGLYVKIYSSRIHHTQAVLEI